MTSVFGQACFCNFLIFAFFNFPMLFQQFWWCFKKSYIFVHFWNGVRKPLFSTAGTPPRLQPSAIEWTLHTTYPFWRRQDWSIGSYTRHKQSYSGGTAHNPTAEAYRRIEPTAETPPSTRQQDLQRTHRLHRKNLSQEDVWVYIN